MCDAAAGVIEGQTGSRASWKSTALTDFRGHFSQLFRSNAAVAAGDATELASRLREVADRRPPAQGGGAQGAAAPRDRPAVEEGAGRPQPVGQGLSTRVFGGDDPPVGPPAAEPTIPVSPPVNGTRETPSPGSGGGGGGGTSSARPGGPARLRQRLARRQQRPAAPSPPSCRSAYSTFTAGCGWGRLEASGVFTGFDKYLAANEEDVRWATLGRRRVRRRRRRGRGLDPRPTPR